MRTAGRTALTLAALLSAGLSLSACTASDQASTATGGASTPAATAPETAPQPSKVAPASGPPCTPDQFEVTGALGAKPTITVPKGCTPQDGLLVKDVEVGTGPEVKQGSTATVHYVLNTFSDQKFRESSWDTNQPFPVENVGQARVIQGWNEGLVGLKEGGRRLLVVPADKGYGPEGQGDILGGETLVFAIDAVKVEG